MESFDNIEKEESYKSLLSFSFFKSSSEHLQNEVGEEKYWMRDENVSECYDCKCCNIYKTIIKGFTLVRRKHHCRLCGQIFCFKCSFVLHSKEGMRVCKYCYNSTLEILPSSARGNTGTGAASPLVHELKEAEQTNNWNPFFIKDLTVNTDSDEWALVIILD
jgi:hypothetical protein